jgi:asparagine synthetase B (glutamine-hydrolysing)
MKSSNFGQKITYYQEDNIENNSNKLLDIISKNGFKNFSPQGITSYLTFRYPIGNLTMFGGYKKVSCGFEIENKKILTRWYPKFSEKKISLEKAQKRVEEILIKSVVKLTKGKKIAIPISGGVDSSLMLALCRKIYPRKKIHTYTAGFYGDDEFEYSRLVAKKFGSIHKEKVLYKKDYIGENSLLMPLIRQKAEPLHPNEIALATVEKMAKEDGCDIAVCGEGADDIFGGYGQNFRMYMNYKNDRPFFKFFLDNYRYFTLEDRQRIIKNKYLIDDYGLLESFLDEKEMPQDIKNKVFYFIQKIHTPGLIIRGTNAMKFNNLPPGFPYINPELVNFVNSLPFEFRVRWKSKKHETESQNMYFRDISEKMDIPKYILKKIAEKYLPHKIIYRPKYGFPVPFEKWFKNLKKWSLDQEIFKTDDIGQFNGWKKFMIINLNTFIEEFKKYKNG